MIVTSKQFDLWIWSFYHNVQSFDTIVIWLISQKIRVIIFILFKITHFLEWNLLNSRINSAVQNTCQNCSWKKGLEIHPCIRILESVVNEVLHRTPSKLYHFRLTQEVRVFHKLGSIRPSSSMIHGYPDPWCQFHVKLHFLKCMYSRGCHTSAITIRYID